MRIDNWFSYFDWLIQNLELKLMSKELSKLETRRLATLLLLYFVRHSLQVKQIFMERKRSTTPCWLY